MPSDPLEPWLIPEQEWLPNPVMLEEADDESK